MAHLFTLALALVAAPATAQLATILTCASGGPSYSVSSGGLSIFQDSLPLRAFSNGAWQTAWSKLGERSWSGVDALGDFNATECSYATPGQPTVALIEVALFTYPPGLVRFAYTLPQGLASTNHSAAGGSVDDDPPGASYSTITNFPGFTASAASLANVLTWHESFVTPDTAMASAYGQRGGPVVLYGADVAGPVALLSPLGSFLEAALGDDTAAGPCKLPGCLSAGVSSTFTSLPPGFSQSYVLVVGAGVTATIAAWGGALQAWYAATATPKVGDLTLTKIGYQTDNGAQLCFGCKGPLDACLLGEKAYLDELGVPIQYLSFQVGMEGGGGRSCCATPPPSTRTRCRQNAWWDMGNQSAPWCVGTWEANSRVPMGVPAFQKAFGLPFQLYAPYFCSDSKYLENWTMVQSSQALPGCHVRGGGAGGGGAKMGAEPPPPSSPVRAGLRLLRRGARGQPRLLRDALRRRPELRDVLLRARCGGAGPRSPV